MSRDLGLYVLDGHEPVRCVDSLVWAQWLERTDRKVARTTLLDGSEVSTVFLGLDHQWGDGPPLLFETCVFLHENTEPGTVFNGRKLQASEVTRRYSTWAEAELGHMEMVELVSEALSKMMNTKVAP